MEGNNMVNCEENNDNIISMDNLEFQNNNTEYLEEYIKDINKDNIQDVQYDKDSFQKGISKMSKLCGMITALVNIGITPNEALSYISECELNKQGTEATLEITKIQADANVAASRYGLENAQKNMI